MPDRQRRVIEVCSERENPQRHIERLPLPISGWSDVQDLFWRCLERTWFEDRGFSSLCWIWRGHCDFGGYGTIGYKRKIHKAHRLFYERFVGPVDKGLVLDHLCRVRNCVNPEHLEVVTHTENIRRGKSTKLCEYDVRAIRSSDETTSDLARKYGVTPQAIHSIRRYRTWEDVV